MRTSQPNSRPSPEPEAAGSLAQVQRLAEVLDRHTVVGSLFRREGERIRCLACGHQCLIAEGRRGICKVRFHRDGELRVPFGYVVGLQCDPVEKKPFYHLYPGSDALTFGMMGCDFHCSYCQNWVTSQALRDDAAQARITSVTPTQLVSAARHHQARLLVSSYNEPLITAEWALAVFQEACAAGLACAFVSNGNATPEVLDLLKPWIVGYKIDLKGFDETRYRRLGGTLRHVTEAIRMVHARGIWMEIVTLLIPGFNDEPQELRAAAKFLASVSRDIPWHITAFHPDYKYADTSSTNDTQLIRASEIATEEGMRFVYAGNAPGRVGQWENTYCPHCRHKLIDRFGYLIREYSITSAGKCPKCQSQVPGIWPKKGAAEVRTGNTLTDYHRRLPRAALLSS
jgi:pyruvate formate lyase activating enzyme